MALLLATSMTNEKATPRCSQPQQTAAPTAFSCSTPDPTVRYVLVSWILDLADRAEKSGQGEEQEGGGKMFIMLQDGKFK